MKRPRWTALVALLLLIVASLTALSVWWLGGSPLVDADQVGTTGQLEVNADGDGTLGQTFVARHAGLCGIELLLAPEGAHPLSATLHLRSEPQSTEDVAAVSLDVASGDSPGFYRFSFSPQRRSHGQYYYALLTAEAGSAMVGVSTGATYLDGAAYRGDQPLDAQTSFRLVYSRPAILADLLQAALGWLGVSAAAGLLLIIPGWSLLVWLWPAPHQNWAGRLALAAGIGLALYPLLFVWAHLLGLRLGRIHAVLPAAAGLAALVWHYRRWRPREAFDTLRKWSGSDARWPDLALVIILALVFGARFLVIRTLDAPMWGDSYQHSVITQLLVDNGGLFDSWEPYAPLDSFTYHFGFHAFSAAFHWLTGLDVVDSVLWAGQVVNALAVLALYPLSVRLSRSRWAGVSAVLVAGLLSQMPMFYVNWGRYTQLTGQAILPIAVLVTWTALESRNRDWRLTGMSWIVVGGLAMAHYRVLIFLVVFVGTWGVLTLRRRNWRRSLARLAALSLGTGILVLPWFSRAFAGRILGFFWQRLTTAARHLSAFELQHNTIGNLTDYLPPGIWFLLVAAIGMGLWRRRWGVLLVSLWWFLLFIATNPEQLGLPGSAIISNFALFVCAYVLAGLLVGDLASQLISRAGSRRYALGAIAAALALTGLVATPARLSDAQPEKHAMVTQPDLRAMAWIESNTPEESRFLVNSFPAYNGTIVVGSDAGWWLPLLARRSSTVPPINYGTESWPVPNYGEQVKELSAGVAGREADDPELLALLKDSGVTHIYVGQRQGRVNYGGPNALDPQQMAASAHYQVAYHQDLVWIFALAP